MSVIINSYLCNGHRRWVAPLLVLILLVSVLPFGSSATGKGIFAFQRVALHPTARRAPDSPRPNPSQGFPLQALWEELVGEDGILAGDSSIVGATDDEEDHPDRKNGTIRRVTDLWQRRGEKGWELVELVRTRCGRRRTTTQISFRTLKHATTGIRGGTTAFPRLDHSLMDRLGRSFALSLGYVVSLQSLCALLTNDDFALADELATRLLSPESARAVKTVRSVITTLSSQHGVENVFRKYPPKDVLYSILALGKLQRAAELYRQQEDQQKEQYTSCSTIDGDETTRRSKIKMRKKMKKAMSSSSYKEFTDVELLKEIAYYSVYANAAYGWTLDLALSGRVNLGDLETLLRRTGLKEEEVLAAEWESKTHRPAFFLVRDIRKNTLVLCIRGTLSAKDVLTDLCCTAEDFRIEDERGSWTKAGDAETVPRKKEKKLKGPTFRAHHGMLEAARGVAEIAEPLIEEHMKKHPKEKLVIVGHSLGSGVAALLGTLWERKFKKLVVYGYGSPCVGVEGSKPTESSNIISVVGEGDPFSCLSLGHVADVSMAISHLCEDKELRDMILMRTDGDPDDMYESDTQWCARTMEDLHETILKGEKMYPPGRILFLRRYLDEKKNGGRNSLKKKKYVSVRECTYRDFRDLRLHPRMLDVTRHVPTVYEKLLQDMVDDHNLEKEYEGEIVEFF